MYVLSSRSRWYSKFPNKILCPHDDIYVIGKIEAPTGELEGLLDFNFPDSAITNHRFVCGKEELAEVIEQSDAVESDLRYSGWTENLDLLLMTMPPQDADVIPRNIADKLEEH